MMILIRLGACLWLWLSSGMLIAQDQLVLVHPAREKRVWVPVGTTVRLVVDQRAGTVSGQVWGARQKDSILWVLPSPQTYDPSLGGDTYPHPIAISLSEVTDWYVLRKHEDRHWQEVYNQASLLVGGAIIGGTSAQTLATGRAPHISSILTATIMLTTGWIVKYLPPKWYRASKGWQLRVVPSLDAKSLSEK